MTQQLLSPKIAIQEEQPNVIVIQGASEAVGMLTTTERGPLVATMVQSLEEYQRVFGSYTANSDGGMSAKCYFESGGDGTELWVQRVVHFTDPTDPTTKTSAAATATLLTANLVATSGVDEASSAGPYELANGETLVVSIDGGGNQTFTFVFTAATLQSGSTGTYALVDGQTLTLTIDGGALQTITFHTSQFVAIGAATAAEVAAAINGQIVGASAVVSTNHVTLTSDSLGT